MGKNGSGAICESQEDIAFAAMDEESKMQVKETSSINKNNLYNIQEIFASLVNCDPTDEDIEKSNEQDSFLFNQKNSFTPLEREYFESIVKNCKSKHWNALEEFTIRPVIISRQGKNKCVLYRQARCQNNQNKVFEERKLIATSQLLQELLDVKKVHQKYPEDIETILVGSQLFKKTSEGLANGEMQEKDDSINVFAQRCVFIMIFADVSHEKKLKWRVHVDAGHEACYDEVYHHIRSARNFLKRCQSNKLDSKLLSNGLITASDCYLDDCETIDLALSNLWLEFGREWVDYCFVFLCSWEDCASTDDLGTCVSRWQQNLSANLGIDSILNNEKFSSTA